MEAVTGVVEKAEKNGVEEEDFEGLGCCGV